MSKKYGARRLLSEFHDKGWKLVSIDSLLKRICKTRTIVRKPGNTTIATRTLKMWRTSCSLRRTSQKRSDQLVIFCAKLAFPVQLCTGNSPQSPAKGVASMRQDEANASFCLRRRQIFAHFVPR